jgi:hypothetical protein
MEKPSAGTILLGGAALVVAVAVGVLLVKVRASAPSPDLSSHEIASAQARMGSARVDVPSRAGGMIGAPAGFPPRPAVERAASSVNDDEPAPEPPITSPDVSLERLGKAGLAGAAGDDGEDGDGEGGGGSAKQMEANRLYDRGDYESASQLADEILKEDPDNARVLRIATSSACVMGEADKAKGLYARLSPRDQRKIVRRCKRYGIEF